MQRGQLKFLSEKLNTLNSDLILDSLKEDPVWEIDHSIWFVTDIGIIALLKSEENFETYSLNVKIEANKFALDITK